MPVLRTRAAKTSALTQTELDNNFKRTVTQQTTTYQVLISDNRSIIEGNHATTAFTITLPPVATADDAETGDFEVTITNINAAIVTVDGSGAELIDGAANLALNQWDSATFQLDSAQTGWKISSTSTLAPVIGNTATNAIMELVWPVGSVYESSAATDPNTLFGVGTWTPITDVIRMAAGSTYTAGDTGGSADAIVVSHNHDNDHNHAAANTGNQSASHTHNIAHTHTITDSANSTSNTDYGTYNSGDQSGVIQKTTGAASPATSGTQSASHTHSFNMPAYTGKTSTDGSSGTGANLPPYKVYYAWERTA